MSLIVRFGQIVHQLTEVVISSTGSPLSDATFGPGGDSAVDLVANTLRTEILEGKLLSGARLKDTHLSARFTVSRNTMREALRELASRGLVVNRRNVGCTVRLISEEDVRDIYSVRRVLESQAVLGSSAADRGQLSSVSAAIDNTAKAAAAQEWKEVGTASLYFHQALVGLIDSPRLNAFFENILAELRLVFAIMDDESTFQQQWVERDREIATYLLSGRRSEANEALDRYLNDSESLVIDTIRQARPSV